MRSPIVNDIPPSEYYRMWAEKVHNGKPTYANQWSPILVSMICLLFLLSVVLIANATVRWSSGYFIFPSITVTAFSVLLCLFWIRERNRTIGKHYATGGKFLLECFKSNNISELYKAAMLYSFVGEGPRKKIRLARLYSNSKDPEQLRTQCEVYLRISPEVVAFLQLCQEAVRLYETFGADQQARVLNDLWGRVAAGQPPLDQVIEQARAMLKLADDPEADRPITTAIPLKRVAATTSSQRSTTGG